MTLPTDCKYNTDPLKLARTGTSQEQRLAPALEPTSALVDERTPAHGMVFAQAYAAYLKYYNGHNVAAGDWQPFFSEDVSVQLAVAAVQDVEHYRQKVREYLDFLNDSQNSYYYKRLRDHLDFLFSCCATLAIRLDRLLANLPSELPLKDLLKNLVQSQLALALQRLIAYHKGGDTIGPPKPKPINDSNKERAAPFNIFGGAAVRFSELGAANLSTAWTGGAAWLPYYNSIDGDSSVYGTPPGDTVFKLANHLATHNLFTSILDQFLKAYARTVSEAKQALEKTLTEWDRHEPHYALFLAFLRLLAYARTEMNTLTGRHLDFYYRDILRLKEKAATPAKAHLLVELAKQAPTHLVQEGELFKAGKDDLGKEAFFTNQRELVANQGKVAARKTVYRHGSKEVGTTTKHQGRLYASPVANSADGLGAPLTSPDQSWHPFHNKVYQEGKLADITMPPAEVGFALASHYLLMAEGKRTVTLNMTVTDSPDDECNNEVICLFTSLKGWVEKDSTTFKKTDDNNLELEVTLNGNDPAVTPYDAKVHGYGFSTNLPLLMVKLKHTANLYVYQLFQDTIITNLTLTVDIQGLRTLAVSNDFGPVDTSKPFQPYGPLPTANNALVIGSKEVFQKNLSKASVKVTWLTQPKLYPQELETKGVPVTIAFLQAGQWVDSKIKEFDVGSGSYDLQDNLSYTVIEEPDFTPNEFHNTASQHGFVRLKLTGDFGQSQYQTYLLKYLRGDADATVEPGPPPVGPSMSELRMNYTASQNIPLDSTDADAFHQRQARFCHVAPFGQAEQHPVLNAAKKVCLLPQFDFRGTDGDPAGDAAEFYIGVTGLQPPQNLALLFQVADGTADPQARKPKPHIHWSYLGANEWLPFNPREVEDQTGDLLNSGIITFAIPREASAHNTLLPPGMHWLRGAVASASEAVCRLLTVAAQALEVTFTDKDNDPGFPAKVLPPGTISKLHQPDAAVKKVMQPFPTFGGRGREAPTAFYTRISERLRHKDRAIALWDYERLILEAFPEIYRVKCLNHTHYEPDEGIYRELAPGHVTIVTIPNQQFHNLRNPLQPYTSLGLLGDIEAFLRRRLSCFVMLHVRNPQFEEVRVDFTVKLSEGADETFHVNKLREDITRFLSPWAFPGGGGPSFGGKIYKSVLINFVEEMPYVDYVSNFKLTHIVDGVTSEKNEMEGSKAVSILVSVPASKHYIVPIKPAEEEKISEKCPCEP